MPLVCSNCGGSDIDSDQTRGDAVCTNCGSVLEDNIIVSEVQFQENSIGGTSAIGQFVSAEGNKTGISLGAGFRHGLGQESRAVTLENGRRRIASLGHQLHMNQHCIDTAYNFYKLAVNKRLTRGRRTNHVVAACLYLVCRTEKTSHLLLDFSDILQIDVFTLGRAYLKLAQELYIHLPAVDPCLYIQRFAHKLEFSDKEHEVAMTALRLVSRMKRDWIHHGRRPSGLCGAAILVAARLHGFCRTIKEVVKVVRISDTTIRKRLGEFMDTPSSQLTIDEFQKIDLEEEQDPPCFTQARKKAKQQAEELNKPEITKELETFRKLMDAMLGITGNQEAEMDLSDKTNQQTTNPRTSGQCSENVLVSQPVTLQPSESVVQSDTQSISTSAVNLPINGTTDDNPKSTEDETGELDLAGLDDTELDKCLLTEKEVELKTKLWMEDNKEYLEKLKEKEEREAREREDGNKQEPKKRRKYTKKKPQGPATTAGEAIEKMLVEKKISSKINYEVLRGLETSQLSNKKSESELPLSSTPPEEASEEVVYETPEFRVPAVPTRRGGRKRQMLAPLSTVKKTKISEPSLSHREVVDNRKVFGAVVVETGPVEYEKASEGTGTKVIGLREEEDIFDEDEMEEEEPVSAAQLMGIDNEGLEDDYENFEDDY